MRLGTRLFFAALCACILPTTGMASQTLSGVLPSGRQLKILAVRRPAPPQPMHFRFTAPPVNAGVNYALDFCIGPRANPCGLPSDIVVNVPKGQTRLATYSSTLFATRVLAVAKGTRAPVPYSVTITP